MRAPAKTSKRVHLHPTIFQVAHSRRQPTLTMAGRLKEYTPLNVKVCTLHPTTFRAVALPYDVTHRTSNKSTEGTPSDGQINRPNPHPLHVKTITLERSNMLTLRGARPRETIS